MGAWSPTDAKKDLLRVMELDPSLTSVVNKHLQELETMIKNQNDIDRVKLRKMFS